MVKTFSRILICPLNWGMGHATRCVPIINQLLQQGAEVIIAADGNALGFLRLRFPELTFIHFPGIRVNYSTGTNMSVKMASQLPAILAGIRREHRALGKIIRDYQIDVVISDNRFGLWTNSAYSVYITHQIMIRAPEGMKWAEPWLYRFHRWLIRKYDECWVPDFPGTENLSGDLGHRYPLPSNGSFAGFLSRFGTLPEPALSRSPISHTSLLVMLSGPEPQRSVLEQVILKELRLHPLPDVVILQGLPDKSVRFSPLPGVTVHSHLPDEDIRNLILQADVILCRSGYSTLMDLVTLGRNAVLVPTPGQTEQEYLAKYLADKGLFACILQKDFSIEQVIGESRHLPEKLNFVRKPSRLEELTGRILERVKYKRA